MRRLVLLALFLGLPIGEIYLLARAAGQVGALATLLLLILGVYAGTVVMRHHGVASLHRLRAALASSEAPAGPLLEALLAQLAGGLLILPGFISDAIGLCLLIAPLRRWLARQVAGSANVGASAQAHVIEGEYRRRDEAP